MQNREGAARDHKPYKDWLTLGFIGAFWATILSQKPRP